MSGEKKKGEMEERKKGEMEEAELPLETSPYVKYTDVEDYKRKGYGTEGHVAVKTGLGSGATDAPTPSGSGTAAAPEEHIKAVNHPKHQQNK